MRLTNRPVATATGYLIQPSHEIKIWYKFNYENDLKQPTTRGKYSETKAWHYTILLYYINAAQSLVNSAAVQMTLYLDIR